MHESATRGIHYSSFIKKKIAAFWKCFPPLAAVPDSENEHEGETPSFIDTIGGHASETLLDSQPHCSWFF